MQQLDITVPNTGAFTAHAPGRYIKYLAGNNGGGDTTLIVSPGGQGGNKITLKPGQAYRVADNRPVPDSWTLMNSAGGATITGFVVIGDGRIDDNTLSGVVSTVDGGKARTMNGTAFAGYANGVSGAAQYMQLQLWNPASNPNRQIVEAISLSANSPLVSAVLQLTNASIGGTMQQYGQSKKAGGAASVGEMHALSTLGAVPAAPYLMGFQAPVGSSTIFKFNEPVVVLPGYGLTITNTAANEFMGLTVEWYEEPNV